MQLKVRLIKQALLGKGFVQADDKDHWFYFFHYKGRKSNIYTKISHGETEIQSGLCSAMARQLRLTGPQFGEFVECTLTAEEYVRLLLVAKHLSEESTTTAKMANGKKKK